MSEDAPETAPPVAPPPVEPAKKKLSRLKRWRRRFKFLFLTLLVLFVIFRVALQFMLPTVLRRTARAYGLAANYERHEMDFFGGDVGIWHLVLAPLEGGQALLKADYCRGDVSTWDLIRGRLVVRRIEAEGLDVLVERDAHGEVALLKKFAGDAPAAKTQARVVSGPAGDIDLTSPFQLDTLRIDRVHAHVRDLSVTPALDATVEFNLRLTDLRSPSRPTGFDLDLSARPLLDSLRAKGQGRAAGKSLDATLQLVVSGLHPSPAAGYLTALGIKPIARDLSMTANAHVSTAATSQPAALAAKLALDTISLIADGEEVAGLDKVDVDASSVSATFADVATVLLQGGHATAERSAAGAIRVAGVELVPTTAPSPPATQPAYHWAVDRVDLVGLRAEFKDAAARPAADLAVAVDRVSVRHLTDDPARAKSPIELAAKLSAPGVARSIDLKGSATILGEAQRADLSLNVAGIKPDALRPYLDAISVDCLIRDGTLSCAVAASLRQGVIDAQLNDVTLGDGAALFALHTVRVGGLRAGGADGRIHVASIDVEGPALDAKREASGQFVAAGFRTKPPRLAPVATVASTEKGDGLPPATAPAGLPKFDVGRLTWKGVALRFEDDGVTPPTSLKMDDAGVEITHLRLDADPNGPPAAPADINAWCKIPGLAGDLSVKGKIVPAAGASTVDLDVAGTGLTADPIRSYLHASGIEPVIRDASLKLHLHANLKQTPDGSVASLGDLNVSDLQFADAGGELVGVGGLSVNGLNVRPGVFEIAGLKVDRPHLKVRREKDGTFTAAGIHTLLLPTPSVPATQPTSQPEAAPFLARLAKAEVNDAVFEWTDDAAASPVNVKANVTAKLDDFSFGGKAQPAKVAVTVKVDGSVDRLSLSGSVVPSVVAPEAHLDVDATGLRAGALAAYLPPELHSTLKDGRLKLTLDAGVSPNLKGGLQGRLVVDNLDYRDGAAGPALLHFANATVKVSRFDVPHKVVAFDELSVAGLDTDVATSAAGAKLLGIELVAAPPAPVAPVAVAKTIEQGPVVAATDQDVARMVAASRLDLPLITVAKLNVGVHHLGVGGVLAEPLAIDDLSLTGANVEMLGDDSENRRPIDLSLTCRPLPLAESLTVNAKVAPFALRPSVKVTLATTGIKGDRLLSLAPDLKPQIDASALTDGQIKAEFRVEVKMDRRDLLRRDFSRPFDADVSLKNFEFRNGDGPTLAALEDFRSEGIHVEPKTGAVRTKSVEITNLAAAVTREKDGLHAMGIVLRAPSTQPTTAPVAVAAPTTAPTTRPSAELRVDALIVSGINLRLEDRAVDPPLVVPLTGLEFEARDLSNLLLYDADKSTRFSLLVNAGKVALPRAVKKSAATTEPTTSPAGDERELFSQLSASGKLSLYPEPKGWVKISLGGLELAALKGEARQLGFDLSGGTFDANVDARFLESGTLELRPKFTFVDLGVSEPQKGPIERLFALPISLDGAITMLQDASGQIAIPLHVVLERGKVDTGAVVGSAIGAVGGVVVTAVASAPLKAGLGVASLVGVNFNKKRPPPEPLALQFDPAATALFDGQGALSPALIERLTKEKTLDVTLRHDLGAGDVTLVGQRANPAGDDALAVSYQLRQSKMELLKERAEVAGKVRGELGSGLNADGDLEHLKELERELAVIEDGLDDLNERVRPGAGRQAMRRTRAACIALGEQRLIYARDLLLASGVPNAAARVHVAHAKFNPDDDAQHGGKVVMTFTPRGK